MWEHEAIAIWVDPSGQQPARLQPFDELEELCCPYAGYVLHFVMRGPCESLAPWLEAVP